MAKEKRHFVMLEVSKEEEQAIDQRAKQEGVNRSQYIREAIMLEFFMSGDLEAYKYLGRRAGVMIKESIADKVKHWERGRGQASAA